MNYLDSIKNNLQNFKFTDYFRHLTAVQKDADLSAHRPLRVAILRSYTLDMMEPILKLRLILEGFNPVFWWGDYNQFRQEVLDNESSMYLFKPDIVFLMTRIEEILPEFVWQFANKTAKVWEVEILDASRNLAHLADTVSSRLPAQIIVQNMALNSPPFWGIYDSQEMHSQSHLIHQFNHELVQAFESRPNTFIWDFNQFLLRKGIDNIFDPKLWYISSNPFRQNAYIDIVEDLIKYILSALAIGKKCIVLDLDNTLWGGIAGEDGINGISLGHDYPGNCYVDFQRELLKLYHRGIILAINSKNNESDAFEIIDKHPDMVLRRFHFAAYQINWSDKATNLYILAKELNIGTESMIFIDDNPAECELLRQQCPECTVLQMPEKPYLIPTLFRRLHGLENIRLTNEDRKKGEIYQAQLQRKKLETVYRDLDEFLKALEMEIEIRLSDDFTVPRISQLTQKTNQLNMTTRRYSEADIVQFANSNESDVFSISSRDRFGDNGIVGVLILKFQEESCHIDSFMLSCRVIGRTIEQSMIAFIAEYARKRGAKILVGEYIPTNKNKPASEIYQKCRMLKDKDGKFVADLTAQEFTYSPYIKHHLPF